MPPTPATRDRAESSAPPAVVLLSGGLDSATCLALATQEGFAVHALTFRYGQRHQHEVEAAGRVGARYRVARHVVVDIDLRVFGGSALTDDRVAVPKDRSAAAIGAEEVPVTYVPARNTIFLAYALALAETAGAQDIFLGVNALDYSGYPDCRPAYVDAFARVANLATRAGVEAAARGEVAVRLRTPLLAMTKADIVRLGLSMGVDYGQTTSCYDPDPASGAACGHCDACQLRLRGFAGAGAEDPASYVERPAVAARG